MPENLSAGEKYQQEKTNAEIVCDNIRYFISTCLTVASISLICYALGKGYAALPGHPAILYPLLIFVLTLLAYLEGLQVAILALERVDRGTFADRTKAFASHKLALANRGRNVQRFLVGRQFFVVFVVFVIAQLTTYTQMREELKSIPKGLFIVVIETGFPGALVVLAFGQLMPQLVAATHPITFMGLPFAWSVIQLCLTFESFGVTHFSWVLSFTVKFLFGMTLKEDVKVKMEKESIGKPETIQMKNFSEGKNSCLEFDKSISPGNLSVKIIDADKLFAGAEDGLQYVSDGAIMDRNVANWLKDDSVKNTYGVSNPEKFPMPPTIVRHLIQNGQPVPRYLLPPYHRMHIPPHIVAFELLRREEFCRKRLQENTHLEVFDDGQMQHTA